MERRLWIHKFKSAVRNQPVAQFLLLAVVLVVLFSACLRTEHKKELIHLQEQVKELQELAGESGPTSLLISRSERLKKVARDLGQLSQSLGSVTDCKPCQLEASLKQLEKARLILAAELKGLISEASLASQRPVPDPITLLPKSAVRVAEIESEVALKMLSREMQNEASQVDETGVLRKSEINRSSVIDAESAVE